MDEGNPSSFFSLARSWTQPRRSSLQSTNIVDNCYTFDIPASSLEAQVREEAGHTSTHIPKTGSTQVNHREQGDPVQSRRNVTARMMAWGLGGRKRQDRRAGVRRSKEKGGALGTYSTEPLITNHSQEKQ